MIRSGALPRTVADVQLPALLVLAGGAALLVGWWGSSGTGLAGEQVTWDIVGAGGLIAIGVANFLWLLDARRKVAVKKSHVLEAVALLAAATPTERDRAATGPVVNVPSGSLYHRPPCPFVAARRTQTLTVSGQLQQGRRACGVCRP